MRKSLPIRVDSPCTERWAEMQKAAGGRHCARCEKTVIDLSTVTRSAAEAIVRAHGGSMCVRLAANDRGETVFRAERARVPVLAPVALAGLLAACAPDAAVSIDDTEAVLEPDDASTDAHALDLPTTGFGGSLATGVAMPEPPTHAPLVPAVEPYPTWGPGVDGTPTDEQRALTRRKQRQQSQQLITGPTLHHTMGVMACPID
jgi:hypothetical protein